MKKDAKEEPKEETLEHWKDRALRARAELENFRKRTELETEARVHLRLEALLSELLVVSDHLELALAAIPADDPDGAAVVAGVQAIGTELESVLLRHGLDPVQVEEDASFDPEFHEAVETVTEDSLTKPRMELLRRGWRFDDRILRPARVRVIRPPEEEAESSPSDD